MPGISISSSACGMCSSKDDIGGRACRGEGGCIDGFTEPWRLKEAFVSESEGKAELKVERCVYSPEKNPLKSGMSERPY